MTSCSSLLRANTGAPVQSTSEKASWLPPLWHCSIMKTQSAIVAQDTQLRWSNMKNHCGSYANFSVAICNPSKFVDVHHTSNMSFEDNWIVWLVWGGVWISHSKHVCFLGYAPPKPYCSISWDLGNWVQKSGFDPNDNPPTPTITQPTSPPHPPPPPYPNLTQI